MRVGNNPNRELVVDGYAPIVLAVITYLPNQEGYHEGRLNVIKACLESMRANAGDHNYQILVWDNGSCDKLLYWLKRSYQPDFLVSGRNMGKINARASIVRMFSPDTAVGVSDDDMFYYPGWLDAHIEVLNTYPNVGTVSGWPVRTQFRFGCRRTIEWGQRFASKFEQGRFISEQEDEDFCISIGRDYKWHVGYTKDDIDTKLTFRDVETYATGHHCQLMGFAEVLSKVTRYDNHALREERTFEQAIDNAGYLRLTTYKRYTRHIGNVLDKELEVEWQKLR